MNSLVKRSINKARRILKKYAAKSYNFATITIMRLTFPYALSRVSSDREDVAQIRFKGIQRAGIKVHGFTSAGASYANLHQVVEIIQKANINYFIIPNDSPTRYTIGIGIEDREIFWKIAQVLYCKDPIYAGVPATDGKFHRGPYLAITKWTIKQLMSAKIIRLAQLQVGPNNQVLADFDYGCDVEFWENGKDLRQSQKGLDRLANLYAKLPPELHEDTLIAPRSNPVSDVLPSEVRIAITQVIEGRAFSSYECLTLPTVDDIQFPIDAVYTWVDGDDPTMRAKRQSFMTSSAAGNGHLGGSARYTSRDELKYSLRSLHMFAPFIRNIYLVTDNQVPDWLDTDKVTVVDHKDIFSDHQALPVFNSHAIETQLHHIEGLSEHYIYLNDDVFFGYATSPHEFFTSNGIIGAPVSTTQIGVGSPKEAESATRAAGKNVRELILRDFKFNIAGALYHTPHPQRRSINYQIEEQYQEEIERTMRSKFRHPDDISAATLMHHYYALATGQAVKAKPQLRYFDLLNPNTQSRLNKTARNRDAQFICINEADADESQKERVDKMVREFLRSYYPFPSPYEK